MFVQYDERSVSQHMQERQKKADTYRIAKQARPSKDERIGGHAVVIGGGIAGLAAARVAARVFTKVTLVERDEAAGQCDFRSGVPQARHTHNLLPEGLEILERLFPGILSELLVAGGVPARPDQQFIYSEHLGRVPASADRSGQTIYASRPLLEAALYGRIALQPEIQLVKGWDAAGVEVDVNNGRVTGARLRRRTEETILPTDLVIDASGRNSKAVRWLADAGYETPGETRVDAFTGYASMIYRKPADFSASWKMLYVPPVAPYQTRGGILLPLEGNRWHVTLLGMSKDYPPTGEAEFLEFARSLATDVLYNAICSTEPLGKPAGYRLTQNRKTHYERLPRYLEGLLVTGDAVMTLNPVYAQGMSKALMEVQVLENTLIEYRSQLAKGDATGLAKTFQTEVSRAVSPLWRMAVDEDTCWPETVITESQGATPRILPSCRRKTNLAPRAAMPAFKLQES